MVDDENLAADARLRAERAAEREEKQGSDEGSSADAPESDEGYGVRMLCATHARELDEQAHVEVEPTFCDVCNAETEESG